MPLPEQVVGGLPEDVERAAGRVRTGTAVAGERGHRRARQVADQRGLEQRAVRHDQVVHQCQQSTRAAQALQQGPQLRAGCPEHTTGRGPGLQPSHGGLHQRDRPVHERPVRVGLSARTRVSDRVAGLLDRAEEAHDATVAEEPGGERAHLDVLQAGARQVQLRRDAGHVDDVVRGRVGVEQVARDRLVGPRTTTELVRGLEDDDLAARLGQVAGRDQPVVPPADHDHLVGAHACVLQDPYRIGGTCCTGVSSARARRERPTPHSRAPARTGRFSGCGARRPSRGHVD